MNMGHIITINEQKSETRKKNQNQGSEAGKSVALAPFLVLKYSNQIKQPIKECERMPRDNGEGARYESANMLDISHGS
jgi:hypothetical protein